MNNFHPALLTCHILTAAKKDLFLRGPFRNPVRSSKEPGDALHHARPLLEQFNQTDRVL